MRGPILVGVSGAMVAASSLYLLVAVHKGAPAIDGAIASRAAPVEAEEAVASGFEPHAPHGPVAKAIVKPPVIAPPVMRPEPVAAVPVPVPVPASVPPTPTMTTTESGLQYEDVKVGSGATPDAGKTCIVQYTGWLWVDGAKGAQIDSSYANNAPMRFNCQSGQVIKGWDEGVGSMRVGGVRNLLIPASLGYGDHAMGTTIPAGSTLRFEIELVGVE